MRIRSRRLRGGLRFVDAWRSHDGSRSDGFFLDVDQTAAAIKGLEDAAKSTERREGLGRLTITITPPGPVDADTAKRYEDLGVDRLVLMRGFGDMGASGADVVDGIVGFLEEQSKVFAAG